MVAEIEPALEFKVWQAVQGGLDMLILRAKESDLESIRSALSNLRTALGAAFPLVVNAGCRLPKFAQASGYHLPEEALSDKVVRHSLEKHAVNGSAVPKPVSGKGRLFGISVHSAETARQAEELSPDYLLAGTIFATPSHPGEVAGGLEHLREICETTKLPVIAIGGITPENAGDCIEAGAYGVASLSPFKGGGREALAKSYKKAMSGRF